MSDLSPVPKGSEAERDAAAMVASLNQAFRHYYDAVQKELLSDDIKKLRRALLFVATISLAMTLGDIVPTKIGILGVEFPKLEGEQLILLVSIVVAYHLVAFCDKAWSALVRRRDIIQSSRNLLVGEFQVCSARLRTLPQTDVTAQLYKWVDEIVRTNVAGLQISRSILEPVPVRLFRWQYTVDLFTPFLLGIGALVHAALRIIR
jgi:hypothetical protein